MPDPNLVPPIRPTVSVLMPVYNAERYVAEAVESILAQTFADFEFIIIDDGSTDGSRAILERYAARDRRIRLVSRPNRGLIGTLNEMLGQARGELVARMDADDVSLPERFALQVDFLRDNPEVLCLGSMQYVIDANGWLLEDAPSTHLDHESIEASIFDGINPISHPTVMFRREPVLALGGYGDGAFAAEDVDLWLRLGEVGRLAVLDRFLVKYRQHEQSASDRNQRIVIQAYGKICSAAFERRGMVREPIVGTPWRPLDRRSRFDHAIRFGWTGYFRGQRDMARHYGIKAVRLMPHLPDGWRLLACALIKPMKQEGRATPAAPPLARRGSG